MTSFVTVNAIARTVILANYKSLTVAQAAMGLSGVDHGSLGRGFGYVVDEFGLYVPCEAQHYFAISQTLIAGSMVAYAYDEKGETIDMTDRHCRMLAGAIRFFHSRDAVEIEIAEGTVLRPQIKVGDKVFWSWPDPEPKSFEGML